MRVHLKRRLCTLNVIAGVIIMLFISISCDKRNESEDSDTPNITGEWTAISRNEVELGNETSIQLTLCADATYEWYVSYSASTAVPVKNTGDYIYDGDNLILNGKMLLPDGNTYPLITSFQIEKLTETMMILIEKTSSDESGFYRYTFIREKSIEENAQVVSLHVAKAGTLPHLIPDKQKYSITSLALTGELNGTDIRYLREMTGRNCEQETTPGNLKELILNVKIVSGGDYYIVYSSPLDKSYYFTTTVEYFQKGNEFYYRGIGPYMFMETNLETLVIGKDIDDIKRSAFSFCSKLKEVLVDGNNVVYSSAEGVLMNKNKSVIYLYPSNKSGNSYKIMDGVKLIENSFQFCKGLKSLTIPASVEKISGNAFWGCTALEEIHNYRLKPQTFEVPVGVSDPYDYVFSYVAEDCTLYVPRDASSYYKKAAGWSRFKQILEE